MSLTETRELAAQRTMERILDAAERSIGQKGFSAATLADIATEAGVSKGLVNYHFSSKEQLLLEVQARVFRRIAAIVRRLAEEGRPSLPTALVALDRVWEILQLSREQVPFTLELWGQATRRPELRERLDRFTVEMTALMRGGIEATT